MDVIRKTNNGPKTLVARSYDYTGFDSLRRSMRDVIEAQTSAILVNAAVAVLANLEIITIAIHDPRRPRKLKEPTKGDQTAAEDPPADEGPELPAPT